MIVKNNSIQIDKLELGPYGTNAYIVTCLNTCDSVLIDAPAEAGKIVEKLKDTSPRYILMTHNHMDHTGALVDLCSELKVPLVAHALDARNLPVSPEMLLTDGDTVSFGDSRLDVIHTPGHTPGSICFKIDQYLISGDTIFPGGPGRTKSPADFQEIIKSITEKLFLLSDDTEIYPGHGDSTVMKKVKEEYAVFSSRNRDQDLCGDVLWLSA
ncbi:MBL fold metallo-hydrolase [Chloroflexota bacterium]